MKKIFLDCGTHLGQGLAEIGRQCSVDHTWIVHSWEANPYTFQDLNHTCYPNNYQFHNQAISDRTGTTTLNIETVKNQPTGQGSSIVAQEQWINSMHKGTFTESVNVECIDLSAWVLENCHMEDHVVVKLDIEGAEYSVLPKMIKDHSIDLIDQLFIEWHARFFPDTEKYWALQTQLVDMLRDRQVHITRWS